MHKFVNQAGLPDTRFTHHGDDLAVSSSGLFQSPTQSLDFRISPNKPG